MTICNPSLRTPKRIVPLFILNLLLLNKTMLSLLLSIIFSLLCIITLLDAFLRTLFHFSQWMTKNPHPLKESHFMSLYVESNKTK